MLNSVILVFANKQDMVCYISSFWDFFLMSMKLNYVWAYLDLSVEVLEQMHVFDMDVNSE